jgi:hypothetical protein
VDNTIESNEEMMRWSLVEVDDGRCDGGVNAMEKREEVDAMI